MLTAAYTGRRLPERPGTTVNRCMQGSHFRAFVLNLTAPAAISLSGPEGSTVVVAPTQYRDYCCVFQLPSFMVSAAGVRTIDLSSAAPPEKSASQNRRTVPPMFQGPLNTALLSYISYLSIIGRMQLHTWFSVRASYMRGGFLSSMGIISFVDTVAINISRTQR